jgi:hypothetical protein
MSGMTVSSPSPRRVRTPRWLDGRLVAGVILVLAAVLLGATVVSGARHTERRLALTRDLAAGAALQSGDLTAVNVRLPAHGRIYAAAPDAVLGRRLNRPLSKGELVPTAALGQPAAGTTISVPLAARSAPELHRGQRVEIWVSTATCPSTVLLAAVTVQAVHAGSDELGAGADQDVVLSVAPQLADRVVAALADKDAVLRAGVLTGPPSGGPANTGLPSLDACFGATP